METFGTILSVTHSPFKIGFRSKCFTIGSCFANNLGNLLHKHRFDVSINPFSTIYNPISIHRALQYAINNTPPLSDTYGELNGIFFNYNFHSSFSALRQDEIEKNAINIVGKNHSYIKSASVILLTYGTSWVYERVDNGKIVSNCHKMPGKNFKKSLLTQKKIIEPLGYFFKNPVSINPHIKVILTLSPVRHLKDTLKLNAVSKSILRLSCHTLTEMYSQVEYFPAYKIILNDLRDYLLHDSDLPHPSVSALNYIRAKFREYYFTDETNQFIRQWNEVQKGLLHKSISLDLSFTSKVFVRTNISTRRAKNSSQC